MLLVYHYHNTIRYYYYYISCEDIPQLTTANTTTSVVSDPYHISHDEVCTLLYSVIVYVVPFT